MDSDPALALCAGSSTDHQSTLEEISRTLLVFRVLGSLQLARQRSPMHTPTIPAATGLLAFQDKMEREPLSLPRSLLCPPLAFLGLLLFLLRRLCPAL